MDKLAAITANNVFCRYLRSPLLEQGNDEFIGFT
jgi:hypothetical protein